MTSLFENDAEAYRHAARGVPTGAETFSDGREHRRHGEHKHQCVRCMQGGNHHSKPHARGVAPTVDQRFSWRKQPLVQVPVKT